jgi:hypothetical protein
MATAASPRPIDWFAYIVWRVLPAAGLLAGAGLIGEQIVRTARFVASASFSGEWLGYLAVGLFLGICATFFLGVLDFADRFLFGPRNEHKYLLRFRRIALVLSLLIAAIWQSQLYYGPSGHWFRE